MSHFTVGIITKKEPTSSDIEDILAPFDENKEVRHIITKAEIIAKTREDIEHYKNTTYKKYLEDPEGYLADCDNEHHINYLKNEFPKRLAYTDEECYQDGIRYYEEKNILPNGDVVSYYNPDSKWDWYEIGGRWDGLIINAVTGKECNSAKVSDIKNTFDDDTYKKAIRFWELYIEGQEPQNNAEKEMLKNLFYNKEYFTKYFGSKKDYAKCQASFTTYALIDEYGLWHEKGKMGWWGISDQTEDAEVKWLKKYEEYLKDARKKGYWITIVDCHI